MPDAQTTLSELSTLSTQLEELAKRVTIVAETYAESPDSRITSDLFAVERALHAARRSLDRATGTLKP